MTGSKAHKNQRKIINKVYSDRHSKTRSRFGVTIRQLRDAAHDAAHERAVHVHS